MQECCQYAHPKDKRERKGKEQRTISIFFISHYLHPFVVSVGFLHLQKDKWAQKFKTFSVFRFFFVVKKNTQEVSTGPRSILPQYSKLKHAAKMSSDEKNKESCIVLIVTLSGIIQREEVQGQHTEKLQTTSLQSTLKRCTSFKIHYSPITNVKSIYSCSMLVQKAYNTAWRAFFFFFTICYSL